MKRVGFAYNPTDEAAFELRERALGWCAMREVDAWAAPAGEIERLVVELGTTDILVVLGGDGTFLRAARAVAAVDVPILGINSGKVGFLSKAESDALDQVLMLLGRGAYTLEPRMVLQVRTGGPGGEWTGEPHSALNEAAIVRGSQARVVRLEVSVDDSHLASYICDGIVVASPTGLTGYSFSAGGPIVDPSSRNLVLTPIAAYLSALRSSVVGPQHRITVRIVEAFDCLISIDGREEIPLRVGDVVEVTARERPIRFVQPHGALPFWDLLRQKAALLPS